MGIKFVPLSNDCITRRDSVTIQIGFKFFVRYLFCESFSIRITWLLGFWTILVHCINNYVNSILDETRIKFPELLFACSCFLTNTFSDSLQISQHLNSIKSLWNFSHPTHFHIFWQRSQPIF